MNKDNIYKLKVDIQIDNALQQLRTIKKEIRKLVKECHYELNKLTLKRKDILVIKLNGFFKETDRKRIKKQIKKAIHRKVFVIDDFIKDMHILEK